MKPITEEDRKLAAESRRKRSVGERPTQLESRAQRRVEKAEEYETKRSAYRTCPKPIYIELTGRTHQVLNNQIASHRLPLSGDILDLGAVLRRFHDVLADMARHGFRYGPDGNVAVEREGANSQAVAHLGTWRNIKAQREQLRLDAERRSYIPREDVHRFLGELAAAMRTGGERLQREVSPIAYEIHNDVLAELERIKESWGYAD